MSAENNFNPGEGWVEVVVAPEGAERIEYWDPQARRVRFWVRDLMIPPLPTKPFTVIRVKWRGNESLNPILMRFPDDWYGEWGWSDGDDYGDADTLAKAITGFEILSAPMDTEAFGQMARLTARQVIDRVREQMDDSIIRYPKTRDIRLNIIAREFEVETEQEDTSSEIETEPSTKALPTELYTVIRVIWITGHSDLVVLTENGWRVASRQGGEPQDLAGSISDFEVVARAVGTKEA